MAYTWCCRHLSWPMCGLVKDMAGEVDIGFIVPRDLSLMSRILQPPVYLFCRFLYLIYGDSYLLHPHCNRTHILELLFECVQLLCVRIPYVPALLDSLRHAAMGFYQFFLSIFILKNCRRCTRIYTWLIILTWKAQQERITHTNIPKPIKYQ